MTIEMALRNAGINRLDAEVLLAHILGMSRAALVTRRDDVIKPEDEERFDALIARRKTDEPVALLVGEQEFYGRSFIVTHDVLIPRPATEALIDCVERTLINNVPCVIDADTQIVCGSLVWKSTHDVTTIVDVGTGSGCIAVTLALLHPAWDVIAIDTSNAALHVAERNAKRHGVQKHVAFHGGDLLTPIQDLQSPFFVVSNPPYIPDAAPLPPSVARFEPHTALFGGSDGMDVIHRLLAAAKHHPLCCGIALECRTEQWKAIAGR